MANHQSAKKRFRQDVKKHARNAGVRSSVHTAEKKLIKAIEGKGGSVEDQLPKAVSQIMKARGKGVLHPKTASRKVARLSKAAAKAAAKQAKSA